MASQRSFGLWRNALNTSVGLVILVLCIGTVAAQELSSAKVISGPLEIPKLFGDAHVSLRLERRRHQHTGRGSREYELCQRGLIELHEIDAFARKVVKLTAE